MPDEKPEAVDETANFETTNSDMPEVESNPEPEAEASAAPEDDDGAPAGENEQGAGDDAPAEPAPKKKAKVQKRIDKLVKDRAKAETRAERLERENSELKAKLGDKPESPKEEPQETDFESYDEYLDAIETYEAEAASPEPDPAPKADQTATGDEPAFTDSQQEALSALKAVVDEADKPADFDAVAMAEDVPITAPMIEVLAECDDPAKVMYALGSDKSLAGEIANMSGAKQALAIAKLDMGRAIPPKPQSSSTAPDPIAPASGVTIPDKAPSEMSFKEFEAHRNKQESRSTSHW
jgi:hypothetical protein